MAAKLLLSLLLLLTAAFSLPTNVILRVEKSFETMLRDVYVPQILAQADHIKARDCEQQGSNLLLNWRWKLSDIKGDIVSLKPQSILFSQTDSPNSLTVALLGGAFTMQAKSEIEVNGMETRGIIEIRAYIDKIAVVLSPTTRARENGLLLPDMHIDDLIIVFNPDQDLQIEADLDLVPDFLASIILDFIKDNQADHIRSSIDKSIRRSIAHFFDKLYKESELVKPLPDTNLLVAYSMAGPIHFHSDFTLFPLNIKLAPADQIEEVAPYEPRPLQERAPLQSAEIEISEHLIDSFLYLCSMSHECYYEVNNTSISSHSLHTDNLALLFPDVFSSYERTNIKLKIGIVPASQSKVEFEDSLLSMQAKFRVDFLLVNETTPLFILELMTQLKASLISLPGDAEHLMFLKGHLQSLYITKFEVFQSKVGDLRLYDFDLIAEGAMVLLKGTINQEFLKNAYPLKKESLGLIQLVSGSLALSQDYLAITGAFQPSP